jgi:hypothetical protein
MGRYQEKQNGSDFNSFPSGNGPFSDKLCSPQVYFLNVRSVRLVVNLCAVLLFEKIAQFQIGTEFVLVVIFG